MKRSVFLLLIIACLVFFSSVDSVFAKPGKGKGKGKGASMSEEHGGSDHGKPDKAKGPKGGEKALDNIVKQMEKEEDKHRRRVAKLEAILEKMKEKNNTNGIEKVQQALAKENKRYEKKMDMLHKRDSKARGRFEEKMKGVRAKDKKSKGKGKK